MDRARPINVVVPVTADAAARMERAADELAMTLADTVAFAALDVARRLEAHDDADLVASLARRSDEPPGRVHLRTAIPPDADARIRAAAGRVGLSPAVFVRAAAATVHDEIMDETGPDDAQVHNIRINEETAGVSIEEDIAKFDRLRPGRLSSAEESSSRRDVPRDPSKDPKSP